MESYEEISAAQTADEMLEMAAGLGAAVFVRLDLKFHLGPFYRWLSGHIVDASGASVELRDTPRRTTNNIKDNNIKHN